MFNQKIKLKVGTYVKIGSYAIPEARKEDLDTEKTRYGRVVEIPSHKRFYVVGVLNSEGKVIYKQSFLFKDLQPVHKHQVPIKKVKNASCCGSEATERFSL